MKDKSGIPQFSMPKVISQGERETRRKEQIRHNIANVNENTLLSADYPIAELQSICKNIKNQQIKLDSVKELILKSEEYLEQFDTILKTIFPTFFAIEFRKDENRNDVEYSVFREGGINSVEVEKAIKSGFLSRYEFDTDGEERGYLKLNLSEYNRFYRNNLYQMLDWSFKRNGTVTYLVNSFTKLQTALSEIREILNKENLQLAAVMDNESETATAEVIAQPEISNYNTLLDQVEADFILAQDSVNYEEEHLLLSDSEVEELAKNFESAAKVENNNTKEQSDDYLSEITEIANRVETQTNKVSSRDQNDVYANIIVELAEKIKPIAKSIKLDEINEKDFKSSRSNTAPQGWLAGKAGLKAFGKYIAKLTKDIESDDTIIRLKTEIKKLERKQSTETSEVEKQIITNQIEECKNQIRDHRIKLAKDIETIKTSSEQLNRVLTDVVKTNTRLIHSFIKRYFPKWSYYRMAALQGKDVMMNDTKLTYGEVYNRAQIALIDAMLKFDPAKNGAFSTFYQYHLLNAVTTQIRLEGLTITLPAGMAEQINQIKRTERQIRSQHPDISQRDVNMQLIELIGDAKGRDTVEGKLAYLNQLKIWGKSTLSLDHVYHTQTPNLAEEGYPDTSLEEKVDDSLSPIEYAEKVELRSLIAKLLDGLTPRERDVIKLRNNEYSLEAIANEFSVTPERIRQIQAKASRKMRHPNRNAALEEYVKELE